MMAAFGLTCVFITSTVDSFATVHYVPELISFFASGNSFTVEMMATVFVIAVARCIAAYLSIVLIYNAGQRVLYNIRKSMFTKMASMQTSQRAKYSSAELNSMMTYNCEQIQRAVSFAVRTGLQHAVFILQSAFFLVVKSGLLSLITLVFMPIFVLVYKYFGAKCRHASTDAASSVGVLSRYSDRSFNAMNTLKLSQAIPYVTDNFNTRSQNVYNASARYTHYSAMLHVVSQLIIFLPIVVIFYMSRMNLIVINTVVVSAFLIALASCLPKIRQFSSVMTDLYKGYASYESILALFGMRDECTAGDAVTNKITSITIDKLSFSYAEQQVLDNVSLNFETGMNAIVGSSGSGKTTLVHLLCGFYPYNGSILIGDQELDHLSLPLYRRKIAFLSQDIATFDSSIANNIVLSDEVDHERLEYAIQSSALNDLVDSLPEGLDTVIGPSHQQLSGGQLQRLALARALYKKSDVIILDEPTSAVDHDKSHEIIGTLRKISDKHIIVLITHDKSIMPYMDYVYALENGRVSQIHHPQGDEALDAV